MTYTVQNRPVEFTYEGRTPRKVVASSAPSLSISPGTRFLKLAVCEQSTQRIQVLGRKTNAADPHWYADHQIHDMRLRGVPYLAAAPDDSLHLIRESNGALAHMIRNTAGQWSEVTPPDRRYKVQGPISIVWAGDQLHLACRFQGSSKVGYMVYRPGRGWSRPTNPRGMTSSCPPVLAANSGGLHLFTTDGSANARTCQRDPMRNTAFGPLQSTGRKVNTNGIAACGSQGADYLFASWINGGENAIYGLTPLAPASGYLRMMRHRGSGQWSARAYVPKSGACKGHPGLAIDKSTLITIGRTSTDQLLEWQNRGADIGTVRVAYKVVNDASGSIPDTFALGFASPDAKARAMTDAVEQLFANYQIELTHLGTELITVPEHLEEIHTGDCVLQEHSSEQKQLFRNRNGLGDRDIAIYVVRRLRNNDDGIIAGCAAPRAKACVINAWEDVITLAHEIGHVLGLSHYGPKTNLMYGGGTGFSSTTVHPWQAEKMLTASITVP